MVGAGQICQLNEDFFREYTRGLPVEHAIVLQKNRENKMGGKKRKG